MKKIFFALCLLSSTAYSQVVDTLRVSINAQPKFTSQLPYTVYGNQTSATALPTFSKLSILSINTTGTPSSTTYLRGDSTWATVTSGGTPGGSDYDIQTNVSGVFAGDTSFKYLKTGLAVVHSKKYASLKLATATVAQANGDTIVGLFIKPYYNVNGKTSVLSYDINIGNNYLRFDSLYNYSIGVGSAARPATGHLIAIGFNSGQTATAADYGVFIGRNTGQTATNAARSVFIGQSTGSGATNASQSVFLGEQAGSTATGASTSNFIGTQAGRNASSASNANFLGYQAGDGATSATFTNYIGYLAGAGATGANNSNFIGRGAGMGATGATQSNFIGTSAGNGATNATNSVFIGTNAGAISPGSSHSNFLGANTGLGATSATYSNFFGYKVGDSTTHKITGANNHLIGTNITTPTAATANSMNFGAVLYLTGIYGTTTGASKATAQTAGQLGVNVTTPDASAALEVKSTTAGLLLPRMTAVQGSAIASPADGLLIYVTDTDATFTSVGFWGRLAGTWTALHL